VPYLRDYGEPRDLLSYVFLTQLVQAEALKTAIEHCRRRKFLCGGALYWSFNAPWPNACWETVDYYGRPKMGYYFAKRAFAPVLVSPLRRGDEIEVWVVNDELRMVRGVLKVSVVDVERGEVIGEREASISVEPNSSSLVARYKLRDLGVEDPEAVVLCFRLEHDGGESRNVLLLARHRDVRFSTTSLELEVVEARREGDDAIIEVEVGSERYARLAFIDVAEDYVAVASDNFFDLLPGERRRITLRVKKPGKTVTVIAAAYNAPTPVRRVVEL